MYLNKIQENRSEYKNLFMPYIDDLYQLALRLTYNTKDAEDLVEESYLKGFRSFGHWQEGINAKSWIFAIMLKIFEAKSQKTLKKPETTNSDYMDIDLIDERFIPLSLLTQISTSGDNDNINVSLISVTQDVLIAALEIIPRRFRIAMLLSYGGQFNYGEIAEITGASTGITKLRIFIGRKLLQKQLFDFVSN